MHDDALASSVVRAPGAVGLAVASFLVSDLERACLYLVVSQAVDASGGHLGDYVPSDSDLHVLSGLKARLLASLRGSVRREDDVSRSPARVACAASARAGDWRAKYRASRSQVSAQVDDWYASRAARRNGKGKVAAESGDTILSDPEHEFSVSGGLVIRDERVMVETRGRIDDA